MISEIEKESHIVVKSKDLLKIIKILRLKTVKTCSQTFYKHIIDELDKSNNKKILFFIKKTPKLLKQYWSEIYEDGKIKNKIFETYLQDSVLLYKNNYIFFNQMQSLAELSQNGDVYLSKQDALTYYNLKVLAAEYNHASVENVDDYLFDIIVKMIYKLHENI